METKVPFLQTEQQNLEMRDQRKYLSTRSLHFFCDVWLVGSKGFLARHGSASL
jgi:hypothetical protein